MQEIIISEQPITIENIYSTFGRFDQVATFFFKEGSTAYENYGPYITGSIRYRPADRLKLQNALESNIQSELLQIVKLGYVFPWDDRLKCLRLRKDGFSCNDIKEYLYFPTNDDDIFTNKDERELPNVVTIMVDTKKYPLGIEDSFTLSRYEGTLSAGWEFIDEEKYEFIGIDTALNDGTFPEEYLSKLNLNVEEIRKDDRFWFYYYTTKNKRKQLSDDEKEHLSLIKARRIQQRIFIIANEIKEAFPDINKVEIAPDTMKIIKDALINFKEERVLHIPYPIYWTFQSYAHIYLGHVRETQLGGNFKDNSVFLYRHEDIKDLIRRVLETRRIDIKEHYLQQPRKGFKRHGGMAIDFNGDYYNVDISAMGRIESFYRIG